MRSLHLIHVLSQLPQTRPRATSLEYTRGEVERMWSEARTLWGHLKEVAHAYTARPGAIGSRVGPRICVWSQFNSHINVSVPGRRGL